MSPHKIPNGEEAASGAATSSSGISTDLDCLFGGPTSRLVSTAHASTLLMSQFTWSPLQLTVDGAPFLFAGAKSCLSAGRFLVVDRFER
ncbi:hypothetical protein HPB50_000083 [Hyalomma asiaticum]|uniref:Uncharacterized protein n=1 Tax=Hyalomma asiaticum TaxID=266040 RepID=A0ACB7SA43_HYAAI|nr:hypothetical protein HPB50_000083 [Hyalomma asiaticum]